LRRGGTLGFTTAREVVAEQIRQAIAGVKLGKGIGLQEAQGIDDYADKKTRARYRF